MSLAHTVVTLVSKYVRIVSIVSVVTVVGVVSVLLCAWGGLTDQKSNPSRTQCWLLVVTRRQGCKKDLLDWLARI